MIIEEIALKGAFLIKLDTYDDHRGFFTRAYCKKEFAVAGINFDIVQGNLSFSEKKHTMRGLHYQTGTSGEKKLVKCMHGSILDVMVDLRENSETFGQHYKVELSHKNNLMILVPEGFAHGFMTLEPNTFVYYQVSNYYNKLSEKCIRWNDPFFGIQWPTNEPILSNTDANCPDFK